MQFLIKIKRILYSSSVFESLVSKLNLGFKLKKNLKHKPKIGIAVLIWERAEYLEPCLDSLFKTELYDYDVTFLLNDDGSTDPRVKEIINKSRDSKYKIVRNFTEKGHGSWGAAFNKAVRKLLEIDKFDIVGTCDSDVLFNPDWLKTSVETFLWVKENHKDHKLIKFSCFNSSDFVFHNILGKYSSPFGDYVVKERMGDVTNMFFTEDLIKIGFYEESKDDETLKTEWFKRKLLRYVSTEKSYTEHIGQVSLLNQWRPTPVLNAVHAMNPVLDSRWNNEVMKYRIQPQEYYLDYDREYSRYLFRIGMNRETGLLAKFLILLGRIKRKVLRTLGRNVERRTLIAQWKRNLASISSQYGIETNPGLNPGISSDLELDVVITVIERDLPILKLSLDSIKKNLRHPIGRFKIVAPRNEKIEEFCKQNNCDYIDETTVLPIGKKDITYKAGGYDRSGWLLQQLLKMGGKAVSDKRHYLVADADTLFIRPHVFEKNGKIIFDLSDEYHTPYYKMYSRLTGMYPKVPFSMVSHHTLIDQEILEGLKGLIEEKHGKKWYEAIIELTDKTEVSGFSEFETYGNYFYEVAKEKMMFEYWYNFSANRNDSNKAEVLSNELSDRYNTLSFQYYNN